MNIKKNTIESYYESSSLIHDEITLIRYLYYFKKNEISEFRKYISFVHSGKKCLKLLNIYELILEFHRNKKNKDLKGFLINKNKWDPKKNSDLKLLAEDFLMYKSFTAERDFDSSLYFSRELLERGAINEFLEFNKKQKEVILDSPLTSGSFYFLFHIEQQRFNFFYKNKSESGLDFSRVKETQQKWLKYFTYYYVLEINKSILDYYWEFNDPDKEPGYSLIKKLIDGKYFKEVYSIMKTETSDKNNLAYIRLNSLIPDIFNSNERNSKKGILEFWDIFKKLISKDNTDKYNTYFLYSALRNAIVVFLKNNFEDKQIKDLELKIYDKVLSVGIYSFPENSVMPYHDYIFFIDRGFENNRVDWMIKFNEKFLSKLDKNYYRVCFEYYKFLIKFIDNKYDYVLNSDFKTRDINLKARIICIKMLAQLFQDEIELKSNNKILRTEINELKTFLNNHFKNHESHFSSSQKHSIENFIKYFNSLTDLIFRKNFSGKNIHGIYYQLINERNVLIKQQLLNKFENLKIKYQ